jgi:toxin CcdB
MARFDVYDTDAGLFVDVQTNLIQGLNTRLVVPLLLEDDAPPLLLRKLHPVFPLAGRRYVMATQLMVAVPERALGRPIASLDEHNDRIVAALDMIFLGF